MVLVDSSLHPKASWEFDADIAILTHSTTIAPKYQAVIHCEIVRQAARVVAMDRERLRSGDRGPRCSTPDPPIIVPAGPESQHASPASMIYSMGPWRSHMIFLDEQVLACASASCNAPSTWRSDRALCSVRGAPRV